MLYNRYQAGESAEDIWMGINRPFASHLRQGQLYLWMTWPRYEQILFIYESKFHQQTKEFLVDYNKSLIAPILEEVRDVAQAVRQGINHQTAPRGRKILSVRCARRASTVDTCWQLGAPNGTTHAPARTQAVIIQRGYQRTKRKRALRQDLTSTIPDLPRDITIVSDDRLMQLFSEYVQWQNFAATEFALAEVEEERAEANVRRLEAEGFVLNVGSGHQGHRDTGSRSTRAPR